MRGTADCQACYFGSLSWAVVGCVGQGPVGPHSFGVCRNATVCLLMVCGCSRKLVSMLVSPRSMQAERCLSSLTPVQSPFFKPAACCIVDSFWKRSLACAWRLEPTGISVANLVCHLKGCPDFLGASTMVGEA